eukprot:TRINITY_DN9129_c0_g1_i2.p1 TRINITY_DN9129_c0_g1~~TRINITY_DN9129_c0_g1_i2.p1  ORF type:complete len:571 (-),score=141.79 TRINITY_DN9129_c0_g1_i2:857-2569(-)
MTHDTLYLYKSSPQTDKKPKFKFLFNHATDIDTIDEEGKIDKATPYCFSVTFGAVTKYFCTNTADQLRFWVDHVTWRIRAFSRLRAAADTDGSSKLTTAEMRRLKLKNIASPGANTSEVQVESKAEKAAHKVLRYRKHLDAQIKSTNDFTLFDNLTQATIIIDTKGIVQYSNEQVAKITGHAVKDLLGKNIKILMSPEYATDHDQWISNYITTGRKKIIGIGRDLPMLHKDGTERPIHLTVVDHQQTGNRYFIGTLTQNVNDSSTSSGEFQKNNFSLFDNLLQATIAIDKEGTIEYVNEAVTTISGYTKEEMMGKNVTVLMMAKHAQAHDQYLRNYLKTGNKKVIGTGRQVSLLHKEGNEKKCHLTVTEHFQGGVPFFMGSLNEVTDSEVSSASTDADVDPFALFDSLLDSTIVIGANGTINYANPATFELTGWKPPELIGKNVNMLMTQADARKHDGYLRNYAKTGIKHIIGKGREVKIQKKDRKVIDVHLQVSEHDVAGVLQFIGTLTKHSEEFTLFDDLLDATIVINEQGIIQYANSATKKITGHRPSSLVGNNVKMLMSWKTREVL